MGGCGCGGGVVVASKLSISESLVFLDIGVGGGFIGGVMGSIVRLANGRLGFS